jgi:hypothetical protein
MDDEQLTEEQRRAMLDLLEQAALHDYPNPNRIGCPGSDFLKRLATNRKSISLNDPNLEHVARCSPCFGEFVGYREHAKRNLFTRRAALAVGGAAAAGIAALVVKSSISRESHPDVYEHAEIDLSQADNSRGGESQPESATPQASLPRSNLDLVITLPFASPEGDYEVQILHSNGNSTGLKASGKAYLLGGKTILHIRIDLKSLPPDSYQIGIRRIPFDWIPVPIRIR